MIASSSTKLSPLDTARWGVITASASGFASADLPAVLAFAREHAAGLLIARCSANDLDAAQAMEDEGFRLMDTLVYYARQVTKHIPEDSGTVPVRAVRPGEEDQVEAIARDAFSGYHGHYHADRRLDREQCDAVYRDWARRSCTSKDVADEVLVADLDGQVAAFATLRLNSEAEGEGVLFGVSPAAQGRGIYRSLMVRGMEYVASRGRATMVVSTQVTNIAVQKVWTRLGFEPSRSYYTFHKWFAPAPG